jgi:hypothetical protein
MRDRMIAKNYKSFIGISRIASTSTPPLSLKQRSLTPEKNWDFKRKMEESNPYDFSRTLFFD